MTFRLDHLIITVNNLDEAVALYQAMGFTVSPGGVHASGTTHNALICFADGSYIELLASTGQPPHPGMENVDFSSWLNSGEGLIGFALLSDNLEGDVMALRARGLTVSDPQPGSRTRPDGVVIQWKGAAIGQSISPFFIEDVTPRHLRVPDTVTHPNTALGITVLEFPVVNQEERLRSFSQLINQPFENNTFELADSTKLIIIPLTETTLPPIQPEVPNGFWLKCAEPGFIPDPNLPFRITVQVE